MCAYLHKGGKGGGRKWGGTHTTKVLKGEIIVTSLQKALWEQSKPLSWEVRRTSPHPCPTAVPETGPWALALRHCLHPVLQGAASVLSPHLPRYLGHASGFFSPKYFVQNARKWKKRLGFLSLKLLKIGKKMQYIKNLGAVFFRWFSLLSVRGKFTHANIAPCLSFPRTLHAVCFITQDCITGISFSDNNCQGKKKKNQTLTTPP